MPRNSQGLYTLPPGNPVVPNTLIESTWANTTMDDIGAALTASLPRDGSAPMTGPLTLSAAPITGTRQATTKAYVDSFLAYATGMPIGGVIAYAGINVPAGFFECNGQAVSRTTYADLFAAIGTTYGAGDSSTTFNLPDMRDEFIRGKSDTRPLGNKQAASFASHTHPTSDPGHGHTLSDPGHAHSASQPAHSHGVTDPGHVHGGGFMVAALGASGATASTPWQANTDPSGTGISIQSSQPGVTVNTAATGMSSASNTTGIAIGAAGGAETVPQNIAQIYIIKAVQDSAGPTTMTGISSSDTDMISIDNTNPVVPELDIKSNVAFGTVKLDASGKIPLAQMATTTSEFMGYFDASSGNLPVGAFNSGSYYAISVGGTLTVYDPVTLVASPTVVAVGGQIHYVSGSVTNPTGWYYVTVAGATLASDVQYIPGGTISGTNVQLAISELDSETQAALAGKAPSSAATGAGTSFPPSGGISASNVTAAIQELDTETVKLAGGTMAGNLTGTNFLAPKHQVGVSGTTGNNFTIDASADNGTMKLARNSGQDIMTVDAVGKVTFPQGPVQSGPAFSAYQSTLQALSNGTTKVLYQTEEFDTNNNFDTTLSRFTPTVAGYYQITGTVQGSTSTYLVMSLLKNGSPFKNGYDNSAGVQRAAISALLYLNGTTDYVELQTYSSIVQDTVVGQANTYFQGVLVRAA